MRITFFTKPECSLCDAAIYVIKRVRQDIPFELDTVDISGTGNERWRETYCDHIPVVHLNGTEIFRHRVDERTLRRLLTET